MVAVELNIPTSPVADGGSPNGGGTSTEVWPIPPADLGPVEECPGGGLRDKWCCRNDGTIAINDCGPDAPNPCCCDEGFGVDLPCDCPAFAAANPARCP